MPIVKNAKGEKRRVKDTGWLLRHARNVTSITEWLCTRRSLRDVQVKFGTTQFVIRQAVRVTDGDGNPYHLIACECDNSHQQNSTVCRWCSANEWSGSPDPCSPAEYWIDDKTNERVSAVTGERTSHVCSLRCRCGADLDDNSKCPIKGCALGPN